MGSNGLKKGKKNGREKREEKKGRKKAEETGTKGDKGVLLVSGLSVQY